MAYLEVFEKKMDTAFIGVFYIELMGVDMNAFLIHLLTHKMKRR